MINSRNYNVPIQDRSGSKNEFFYGSPFRGLRKRGGVNHRGKGPKGYRRSDQRLHEEVCEALHDSRTVDASEIEVSVTDGIVYLTGAVEDRRMKREAEAALDHIAGVKNVQNQLGVKRPQEFLSQLTGDARTHDEGLVQNYTSMN